MPKKKQSFEESLLRLEQIIDKIESGDTTLDQSVNLYKEGIELSVLCGERLNEIEKEVTILQKNADNVFVQKTFEREL